MGEATAKEVTAELDIAVDDNLDAAVDDEVGGEEDEDATYDNDGTDGDVTEASGCKEVSATALTVRLQYGARVQHIFCLLMHIIYVFRYHGVV